MLTFKELRVEILGIYVWVLCNHFPECFLTTLLSSQDFHLMYMLHSKTCVRAVLSYLHSLIRVLILGIDQLFPRRKSKFHFTFCLYLLAGSADCPRLQHAAS